VKNDGGPAYPVVDRVHPVATDMVYQGAPGMSMRQRYKVAIAAGGFNSVLTYMGAVSHDPTQLAASVGCLADALVAEDEVREEAKADEPTL